MKKVCDCITSGNLDKPKQHGADPHAKNCAIYQTEWVVKTGNEAWDRDDRSKEFNKAQIDQLLHIPGQQAEYQGWDVRFMGWRVPVNLFVEYGVWIATKNQDVGFWYSTTTGIVRFTGDVSAPIELSYREDEKPRMVGSYGQRDAAVRALSRLLDRLKTLA